MRAFISYSHRDADALGRLHIHLAALRQEGRIDTWFDREILAGDVLDDQISGELEAASLFILIVSPDFIASDYCVNREMQRALERHEAGEARVVPIIIEPCDWKSLPSLKRLKALPKDGLPVSDWANANTAYLEVVQELRRIIDAEDAKPVALDLVGTVPSANRPNAVPRYRVQRDFDEIDRSDYRDAAFLTIKDYFRRASAEIGAIDNLKGRFAEKGANSFNCTVVNRALRNGTAHITVYCRSARYSLSDIYFSFNENAPENTANGGFDVSSDEYEQFLVVTMAMFGVHPNRLTPDDAAKYLWGQFVERAGVAYD